MASSAMTSAHAFVSPRLRTLIGAVRGASARVIAGASPLVRGTDAEDPEAVHDLRVALRRLRTILRALGPVYGERRVRRLRRGLGRVADATGLLRDEEVLQELVARLTLPEDVRAEVAAWLVSRGPVERRLRREVVLLLRERAEGETLVSFLDELSARLDALDAEPAATLGAQALAWDAMRRVVGEVAKGLDGSLSDPEEMHSLRICEKRLRYTAELFAELLGEDGERLQKSATRMQKRLGDLHDVDFALERLERARGLSEAARRALLSALTEARLRFADKVRESVLVHGAALWTAAARG
jgi:CHAD domain-containing protein